MTWTYSGDPSQSAKDEVRFLIGDTNSSDPLLQDAEINWLLADCGTTRFAAVEAAEGVAAYYARSADKAVGNLKLSASQKFEHYTRLAVRLRRKATIATVAPYAGGITQTDKNINRDNTDLVIPFFKRQEFDVPGSNLPQQSTDPLLEVMT